MFDSSRGDSVLILQPRETDVLNGSSILSIWCEFLSVDHRLDNRVTIVKGKYESLARGLLFADEDQRLSSDRNDDENSSRGSPAH